MPFPPPGLLPRDCPSPGDLARLGEDLGRAFKASGQPGAVLALTGTLGAGKTHLAKGVVAGLGGDPAAVTSPTFNLVHEYDTAPPCLHFDFYRMDSPSEVESLGWDDYLDRPGTTLLIVEWADLFPSLLPPSATWLHIQALPDHTRRVTIRPPAGKS